MTDPQPATDPKARSYINNSSTIRALKSVLEQVELLRCDCRHAARIHESRALRAARSGRDKEAARYYGYAAIEFEHGGSPELSQRCLDLIRAGRS